MIAINGNHEDELKREDGKDEHKQLSGSALEFGTFLILRPSFIRLLGLVACCDCSLSYPSPGHAIIRLLSETRCPERAEVVQPL